MSQANQVLRAIEKAAETQFLPIIGPHKGQILAEVVRATKPRRVLEVGTLIGYSAILMGKELDKDAELISIEIHPDEAKQAEENIQRAKIPPSVKVIVGNALDVIQTLKGPFDLAFIDAEKREYFAYLQLFEDKLHQDSVIVADNAGIFAASMKDYLDYVRSSGKYQSKYVPMGDDGVEISVKK